MEFKRITDSKSPEFKEVYEIYQNSFPIFEQRYLDDQIEALADKDYYFEAVKNGNETIGLLLTWQAKSFVYIEHLAVTESARGQNIGTQILTRLKASANVPLILEIDPPIDEISLRRKAFYERLGFVMSSYDHKHPPFKKGQEPYSLKVLSCPQIDDNLYFDFYNYMVNRIMYYSDSRKELSV